MRTELVNWSQEIASIHGQLGSGHEWGPPTSEVGIMKCKHCGCYWHPNFRYNKPMFWEAGDSPWYGTRLDNKDPGCTRS